ncbi:MAG: iron-containing alcohol dehydrogenase [Sphaerochaeta sp.]|jgi:alcohol dehydrogenase YqhD (iron-dependent ADH family)|nr:iron-containing alcohol dehydrogenase [Sphaerochaeta sp.]MCH3920376.1 iron-containing alcohol dehydrogenase [Sphaerochaeta sp.]MCI2044979.1 iron-containing alcohol dehydrogenase [Sphaerochaeta sp.]MCI2076318.1 iron-containing alcohol dehydrogenase [Sphaerochaeta sp.]MCI2096522.1 iron-containing alcohol dehydrogenase [Sphaerochaeta sp.]
MVHDFTYYTPTKVVFGKDATEKVGLLAKEFGAKKVLVHFGSHHAKKSGLIDRVEKLLAKEGIDYVELGGVVPNPRLSKIHEGLELCRKEHVDFLLAVGGGSVIDSCKAIGYGLANGGEPWDFYCGKRVPAACAPIGAVLTISAAGSEMSDSSVVTNEEGMLKRGCNSDTCRCKFAIEDPLLTLTLPQYQTMCGCTDIMMHTMERYFVHDSMHLTDEIAMGLLRTVRDAALVLKDHPDDYDARANVMFASSLSHNGLTAAGNENKGDWACHQLEHEVGGMFDVAHGAGLAAVWPSWARFVSPEDPQRFISFGEGLFGLKPTGNAAADVEATVKAMESFYRSIGMPTNLKELGVTPTEAQIDELAVKCTFFGKRTIGNFKKLGKEEIKHIYEMAK